MMWRDNTTDWWLARNFCLKNRLSIEAIAFYMGLPHDHDAFCHD